MFTGKECGLQTRSLAQWNSIRRWTRTTGGNLRRIVQTPGHLFVVAGDGDSATALYKDGDQPWTRVAVKTSIDEAKVALLPCAEDAGVAWL